MPGSTTRRSRVEQNQSPVAHTACRRTTQRQRASSTPTRPSWCGCKIRASFSPQPHHHRRCRGLGRGLAGGRSAATTTARGAISPAAASPMCAPSAKPLTPQLDALRARRAAADPQRGGAEDEADKRWGTSTSHTCSRGPRTALRTQALAKIYCHYYSLVMITC